MHLKKITELCMVRYLSEKNIQIIYIYFKSVSVSKQVYFSKNIFRF